MASTLPRDLPRTLALFVALPFLAFGAAGMLTEFFRGRPSSTSSVGIVFIPIFAAVLGAGGYALGVVLRWPWRRFGWRTWESPHLERALLGGLVAICVVAAVAGCATVLHYEHRAEPRVLRDTGVVRRLPWITSSWERSAATRVAAGNGLTGRASFPAGDIVVTSGRVAFVPFGESRDIPLDVDAVDYARKVFAAPLAGQTPADDLVVVLVDGRATGQRALLAVFDRRGTVVFEELLDRTWSLRDDALTQLHDPAGRMRDAVAVDSMFVITGADPGVPGSAPR